MELHVLSPALDRIGTIRHWQSMTWEEEYNGMGAFQLIVDDTPVYAAMIRQGCFFYRKDRPYTVMRAVLVERQGANGTITVGGYSVLHMLNWRVATGKRTFKNLPADVYSMVSQELRGLPVTVAAGTDLQETVDKELDSPVVGDSIVSLLEETELGMRMVLDYPAKTFVFEIYKGADRAYRDGEGGYVFSPARKNLGPLKVTEDDDLYKNVAVIVCHNGESSSVFYYPEDHESISGMERRELLVFGESQGDRSAEQWKRDMLQKGMDALKEHNMVCTFTAEPRPGDFGVLYNLGDLVTCKEDRYGVRFDARITQYKHTSDKNGDRVTLTLGKPAVSYVRGELIKYV